MAGPPRLRRVLEQSGSEYRKVGLPFFLEWQKASESEDESGALPTSIASAFRFSPRRPNGRFMTDYSKARKSN